MTVQHNTLSNKQLVKVIAIRHLTSQAFILRMERNGLTFRAGQYITIGFPGKQKRREYSIYSGEQDESLEILALGVPPGSFSEQLHKLTVGAELEIEGPFGYFIIPEEDRMNKKYVFIASGTGISPFHSFVRSYPGLDYILLHGVRYSEETYERDHFDPYRYLAFTTGDGKGDRHGRVTQYLMKHPPVPGADYYFCGNSNMIHDAMEILSVKGVDSERFHAEVYF